MKVKSKLLAALSSLVDHAIAPRAAMADRSILTEIEAAIARCTDKHDVPVNEECVHEILFRVSNAPGSITFLSRRISSRLDATRDSTVALKTLVLLHRLLRGGDRYFEQDLQNMWSCGELRVDLSWCSADKGHLHSFLLSYSLFLEERLGWIINQAGLLEPIRPPQSAFRSHKEEAAEWLLYRLSKSQILLDRIMDCLPSNPSFSSQVMQSAFNIILRESFRVYDGFSDGMEIVVSSYPELDKSPKSLALDVLNKALTQTPSLHDFYENCKRSVCWKSLDYPHVRIITAAQVSSIEQKLPAGSHCPPSTSSGDQEATETSKQHQQDAAVKEAEFGLHDARNILFSQKFETTISTVWVEFDEEDSQNSSFSLGGVDDCLTGASEDVLTEVDGSWQGREATR
ncbi:unnamed protein product [Musa acuminata subsp. malaccensis]|uniref:(wild Malaysian banana) hypothetical protein n=1 Tax=Musa acuminata subsp. malaccensis TaxID=214687 RepID=A0A804JI29_MUSAM|nr:PREDICTED: putative clathrin assembly protein At1g33340 [Musa acuminata subsp. malaccensis]CAG1846761.1 unnamed protein product [Musa acuminata subsp. malaccensis]